MNWETFFIVVGVLNIAGIIGFCINFLLLRLSDSFRDYFHQELQNPNALVYVMAVILFPLTLPLYFADLISGDFDKWKKQQKKYLEEKLRSWNHK